MTCSGEDLHGDLQALQEGPEIRRDDLDVASEGDAGLDAALAQPVDRPRLGRGDRVESATAVTADPEEFADAWRAQYQPSKERVRSGERPYVSLDLLHSENLDTVLRSHDIDPGAFPPGGLGSLAVAWHYLPPWPDGVEGIRQIKQEFIVGPLSSGNTALLVDMAKAAGLPWDVILGSDISRAYKPSPHAYRKPAALLGLDPGEVMLVAAHNSDLEGARRAGLATAFIAVLLNTAPIKPRTSRPLMTGT